VQGVVELPVAAERQAMTDAFCAGHLDWGNAGVAGEGGGEHSECCTHRYRLDEFPRATTDLSRSQLVLPRIGHRRSESKND
jgi:hypothetical protein